MNVAADSLRAWGKVLLESAGLASQAADIVADSLIEANLRGVDSHGALRLPIYIKRLQAGLVNPNPQPRVVQQEGGIASVDADQGPGQVAGVFATDLAVTLARQHGVGAVGVQRSTHYGAAAYYVMRAARQDLLAASTTNAEPHVVPYGGAKRALGTNPLAFAAPAPQGLFVLDMATSQAAVGKIYLARERGESIPEGWAVDASGRPTTNPHDAANAVPLGGPKGYALAIMVEVLSGVFTGAGVADSIGRMYDEWDRPQNVGHFFMVLDPEKAIGRERFLQRMGRLWEQIKATPAAPGFDEILIPGELEERMRQERLQTGIPLPEAVYTELVALSQSFGVEILR